MKCAGTAVGITTPAPRLVWKRIADRNPLHFGQIDHPFPGLIRLGRSGVDFQDFPGTAFERRQNGMRIRQFQGIHDAV